MIPITADGKNNLIFDTLRGKRTEIENAESASLLGYHLTLILSEARPTRLIPRLDASCDSLHSKLNCIFSMPSSQPILLERDNVRGA